MSTQIIYGVIALLATLWGASQSDLRELKNKFSLPVWLGIGLFAAAYYYFGVNKGYGEIKTAGMFALVGCAAGVLALLSDDAKARVVGSASLLLGLVAGHLLGWDKDASSFAYLLGFITPLFLARHSQASPLAVVGLIAAVGRELTMGESDFGRSAELVMGLLAVGVIVQFTSCTLIKNKWGQWLLGTALTAGLVYGLHRDFAHPILVLAACALVLVAMFLTDLDNDRGRMTAVAVLSVAFGSVSFTLGKVEGAAICLTALIAMMNAVGLSRGLLAAGFAAAALGWYGSNPVFTDSSTFHGFTGIGIGILLAQWSDAWKQKGSLGNLTAPLLWALLVGSMVLLNAVYGTSALVGVSIGLGVCGLIEAGRSEAIGRLTAAGLVMFATTVAFPKALGLMDEWTRTEKANFVKIFAVPFVIVALLILWTQSRPGEGEHES
jgi:hypothetical protein